MSPERGRRFLESVPEDVTDWEPPKRGPSVVAAVAVAVLVILVFGAFTALITFLAGPLGLVAALGFATALLAISLFAGRGRGRP